MYLPNHRYIYIYNIYVCVCVTSVPTIDIDIKLVTILIMADRPLMKGGWNIDTPRLMLNNLKHEISMHITIENKPHNTHNPNLIAVETLACVCNDWHRHRGISERPVWIEQVNKAKGCKPHVMEQYIRSEGYVEYSIWDYNALHICTLFTLRVYQ